ncbi:hypothetical protein [Chryseobacterium vrystaatense]|uniref:Uncharacterized protein n=1 Tax=Chryseobacterium vrystaatense TaxID=307480 RepID=A0A1M4VYZ1_9FLAO|nr:hypothetical protein [Chryseobacterium vrystaatense]SHE74177.1 hypothetical protein SAMN02787073_1019 [Chryseobacterium vrystaatense]
MITDYRSRPEEVPIFMFNLEVLTVNVQDQIGKKQSNTLFTYAAKQENIHLVFHP